MLDEKELAVLAERIREVLSPLSRGADLAETLDEAFALTPDVSGCESVGIRWKAGEDYPYLLTRGSGRDFVAVNGPLCTRDAAGLVLRRPDGRPQLACMCGAVIEGRTDASAPFFTEGGSFWTNGTTGLLRDAPPSSSVGIQSRNYCNAAGYESVALIPLRAGDECYGLLQLNSRTPDRFTKERVAEYERVAETIAEMVAQRQP
jgi:hypothetical protein